jgi:hypothetical protein
MSDSIISQVSKFQNNLEEEDLRNILESEQDEVEMEAVASDDDESYEYVWEG